MDVSPIVTTAAPEPLPDKAEGLKYWNNVDSDINAMLGGVPSVQGFSVTSRVDLQGSRNFLAKLGIGAKPGLRIVDSALEDGAGIGRVTEGLLLKVAKQVDIIEPVIKFTDGLQHKPGIRAIHNIGLDDWIPTKDDSYDLVWIQWCVGHLTDPQLVQHLERCKAALNPDGGVIVVKENINSIDEDFFDETDSSVIRQDAKFRALFKQAGLTLFKTELQKGFPKSHLGKLLPVRVYALKSIAPTVRK
ncbi:alpha-N-methyltransferase NTM1 [Truncatella angustata]|uniref:Alpha N-terminal protein methyltransferase 1 n=1 Tax=Truncatella angustata TaxID=152316 RepID=A0A9P8RGC2_9PEZI|nr:alpha-N-methyltransferase NTM1 [Truncatella angustata]KAH6645489.1 alpha-N-methyltransferase NTM1 [Truncatella angustata]